MNRTLLLCVLATAGLLALAMALLPTPGFTPSMEQSLPRVVLPPADRRPLAEYSPIFDKPLFNPGRRKNAGAESVMQTQGLRPLSDYRLVGVVVARDTKFALVERNDSNQVVTLHVGDDLDGRRVADIRIGGVVLNGSEFLAMPRPARRVRRGRF
jgi:hypothetical protein